MPTLEISSPGLWQTRLVYRRAGEDRLAIAVMAGFSLREIGLLEPQEALEAALEALGEHGGPALDAGLPKMEGEFLMAGAAFAPGGVPAEIADVSLSVGSLRRDFLVLGAREAKEPVPGPPRKFIRQPLSWKATLYDQAANPEGIKAGETFLEGFWLLAGPLVQEAVFDAAGRTLAAPMGAGAPASPLPLPPTPERIASGGGTFGGAWRTLD